MCANRQLIFSINEDKIDKDNKKKNMLITLKELGTFTATFATIVISLLTAAHKAA